VRGGGWIVLDANIRATLASVPWQETATKTKTALGLNTKHKAYSWRSGS